MRLAGQTSGRAMTVSDSIMLVGDASDDQHLLFVEKLRYADGVIDHRFGNNGIAMLTAVSDPFQDFASDAVGVNSISGSRTIIAGIRAYRDRVTYVLRSILDTGAPDSAFAEGGVYLAPNAEATTLNAIAASPAGDFLVVGGWIASDLLLARHQMGGALDSSFGCDGQVRIDLGMNEEMVTGIAIDREGKIYASGYSGPFGSYGGRAVVLRLRNDGTLDPSFADRGIIKLRFSADSVKDQANAIALQPDGKILVAGSAQIGDIASISVVVRLNTDGSIDGAYGGNQ